jgi:carbonic anhydrase
MPTKKRLIEKFNHFLNSYYHENSDLMRELADKQNPELLVIACSDSRIDPAILFNMQPGEVFSVRNVANIVPAFDAGAENHSIWAAIEYAIFGLNIKSIMVLGHSNCGGVNYLSNLIRENDTGSFYHLPIWVKNAASEQFSMLCHAHTQEQDSGPLERENVMHSIRNLQACPWIEDRLANKSLALNGFRFDIKNGALETVYSSEER